VEHVTVIATPEWQTAIATWALVLITLAAVVVGAWAALSAASTYRLESEPVIALSVVDAQAEAAATEHSVPLSYVVIGKPALADGIELRRLSYGEARQKTGGSGMPRPYISLQVQNLGRSPAIDLALPIQARVALLSKRSIARDSQDDYVDLEASEQMATGDVMILGIPAQSSAYVRIYHDFGIEVALSPEQKGSIAVISRGMQGSKRRPVAVVVSTDRFIIPDPTTYLNSVKSSAVENGAV
jgi:hypothetical protein